MASGLDEYVNIEGIVRKVNKRKAEYGAKLRQLTDDYTQVLIVTVDNIGSKQIAETRAELRGRAEFLFGKNTMIRKILRDHAKRSGNAKLEALCDIVQGNCGMVFTKESIVGIRDFLGQKVIQCPAKAGVIAPVDVTCPAGPTGMEPTMTAFFQSLNIATRINRGQIDIVNPMQVVFKGQKVGESEAALLIKLGIKPFNYKIEVQSVYDDGNVYSSDVLDITENDVAQAFFAAANQMAAVCLEIDFPVSVTVPHSVLGAYKNILSVGLALESYSWDNLTLVKEILANPDAFRGSGGGGGGAAAGGGGGGAAAEPEPEPSSSKSSEGGGGGLFGGSGSDSDSSS